MTTEGNIVGKRHIYPDQSTQETAAVASCAHMYVTVPVPTHLVIAGTYYKLAGTTDAYICEEFSHSNNRLTYTSKVKRKFTAIIAFSISSSKKDIIVLFELYKNGSEGDIIASRIKRTLRSVGDFYIMSMVCKLELAQNDYVELCASSDTDDVYVTLETLGFVMTG